MAFRVAVGADHGGFDLKKELAAYLQSAGHRVLDCGTDSKASCDYPVFSFKTAEAVARKEADVGLLICRSGIGMAICANKVKGIRAACCETVEQARLGRAHNNANVLVLGADLIDPEMARKVLTAFLETPFEGGRHQRRVDQIDAYDRAHV